MYAAIIPANGAWSQEDPKFKVILCYTLSLDTLDVENKQDNKQTNKIPKTRLTVLSGMQKPDSNCKHGGRGCSKD